MNTAGTSEKVTGDDTETVLLSNEIQLLLSEKRTSLSVLRTGIAVFALPMSVLSILITTSRLYDAEKVKGFLVTVLALSLGLVALGAYLVVRALNKLHALDHLVGKLKGKSKAIADLLT
ncbi:MAG: hypothetical protein KKC51_03845 [Verrucomicrobia bacterium]|nr:hypothetical protein [Verrucomicrobiota bacterium]